MRLILIVATSFLLSANALAATDPTIECGQQLAAQPQFSSIAKKVPLASMQDMTLDMLSNDGKPTPVDRIQIHDWVAAHQDCFRQGEDFRKINYPPEVVAMADETNNKMIGVVADLYAKKLTYGQANKQLQSVYDDFKVRLAAVIQKIQSDKLASDQAKDAQQAAITAAREQQQRDLAARAQQADLDRQTQAAQAQAQADAARRQAALQYLSSHPIVPPQTYQPIPYQPVPITRPTQTNCTTYNNQMNCTTQ